MKTWTIQKRSILNQIQEQGIYVPNFAHKDLNNKSLPNSYSFLQTLINLRYKPDKQIDGAVFCMAPSFNRSFTSIDNIKTHFSLNPLCLRYFVNDGIDLLEGDNVIMELEYPECFSFLDVDAELFCALDDCLYIDYELKGWRLKQSFSAELMERINRLVNDWCNASSHEFLFSKPANLVQQHVPYIELCNIINYYPISTVRIK